MATNLPNAPPPPLTPMDEVVYFFPLRKKDQKYRHSAPPPPSPFFRLPFSKKGNFFSEIFLSSKGADTATPSEITFLGGDHLSWRNLIQRGVRILNGMAVVKLRLQCCQSCCHRLLAFLCKLSKARGKLLKKKKTFYDRVTDIFFIYSRFLHG